MNTKKANVAVIGATGMVGEQFIKILEERSFPVDNIYFFSSARSAGKQISFQGRKYIVEELNEDNFNKPIDIGLFSAGGAISAKYAPILAGRRGVAIDNSSHFRMAADVPLVVPEVNPNDVKRHNGIIANPNCSTIQAVVALAPLHRHFVAKRVIYNTYQAVSGAGMAGWMDLENGLKGQNHTKFAHPIANNVIPQIDVFSNDGYTGEEKKMINETRKILGAPHLGVTATCVRVPVFNGHCVSINAEFENIFDIKEVVDIIKQSPGIVVQDDIANGLYPMPVTASGNDAVFVGRLRKDDGANALNMWVAADNIRKGAATNTVQIAELVLQNLQNK